MKLGVVLPTFRHDASDALRVAAQVDDAGLDGVFAFDHLWPLGSPERPALAPFAVLAAVAATQRHLIVGPLVARVGLVATTTLVEQFVTLATIAPGRVIAALGTGDRLSEPEMRAYGLGVGTPESRRRLLDDAFEALAARSPTFEVWCGAGSEATNDLARRRGVVLNFWAASASMVQAHARRGPVTWAGALGDEPRATLTALRDAGAQWAVSTWPVDLATLHEWREQS